MPNISSMTWYKGPYNNLLLEGIYPGVGAEIVKERKGFTFCAFMTHYEPQTGEESREKPEGSIHDPK